MKKARIIIKRGNPSAPNPEGIMELRGGAKGTGKIIQSVTYWVNSPRSIDAAEEITRNAAEAAEVEIVQ